MLQLHSDNLWRTIKRHARHAKRRSHVAVAYFGSGASDRLPLKRGSTLVVNMGDNAVRNGLTKPSEILAMLKRGIDVHSVANLHAKVFVIGSRAFVGSANVSNNSANSLVEAAVELTSREAVAQCRSFVRRLAGERVTPKLAEAKQKLYRPPRGPNNRKRRTTQANAPTHGRLWAVRTVPGDWQDEDEDAKRSAKPKADANLSSMQGFRTDEFLWFGTDKFTGDVAKGDSVIVVHEESKRNVILYPPRPVVLAQRYMRRRSKRAMIFMETRKGLRTKRLPDALQSLGRKGKLLKSVKSSRLLRDPTIAHAVLNLWGQAPAN